MSERIAVTGIGVVSPIGTGFESFRRALAAGKSGIGEITNFDASELPVQIAGEVRDFNLAEHIASMKTYLDRTSAFALAASAMAISQAGWAAPLDDAGLCLGTAWGCQDSIELYVTKLIESDPKFAPPLVFTHGYANAPNSLVSIEFGLHGHNACFAGGCTAGAAAIEAAVDFIRRDGAQRLLAGGSDAFSDVALRVLLAANLAVHGGRPFDAASDGLVPGEGAAMLALESEQSERAANRAIRRNRAFFSAVNTSEP